MYFLTTVYCRGACLSISLPRSRLTGRSGGGRMLIVMHSAQLFSDLSSVITRNVRYPLMTSFSSTTTFCRDLQLSSHQSRKLQYAASDSPHGWMQNVDGPVACRVCLSDDTVALSNHPTENNGSSMSGSVTSCTGGRNSPTGRCGCRNVLVSPESYGGH